MGLDHEVRGLRLRTFVVQGPHLPILILQTIQHLVPDHTMDGESAVPATFPAWYNRVATQRLPQFPVDGLRIVSLVHQHATDVHPLQIGDVFIHEPDIMPLVSGEPCRHDDVRLDVHGKGTLRERTWFLVDTQFLTSLDEMCRT